MESRQIVGRGRGLRALRPDTTVSQGQGTMTSASNPGQGFNTSPQLTSGFGDDWGWGQSQPTQAALDTTKPKPSPIRQSDLAWGPKQSAPAERVSLNLEDGGGWDNWDNVIGSLPPTNNAPQSATRGASNGQSPRPILGAGAAFSETKMRSLERVLNTKEDLTPEQLEMMRADPDHPLYSTQTFTQLGVPNDLMNALAVMNFHKPSKIQEKALPILLSDPPTNMIAQSQNGTGKTATFLLTMLARVDPSKDHCQCLCMVPTAELAGQIALVGNRMLKYKPNVKITCAVKDANPERNAQGQVAAQVVVGTPGTVHKWVQQGFIKPDALICFVLDEADQMLCETCSFANIVERIRIKLSDTCQRMLFSATYDDKVKAFSEEVVPNAFKILVAQFDLTLKNVKQYRIDLAEKNARLSAILDIIGVFRVGQAIIFCATKKAAHFLYKKINDLKFGAALISSDITMAERDAAIDSFRKGEKNILISTNVTSRGIDVPEVNLVVNWDMPRGRDGNDADCETYLHRIGRSGRFGTVAIAINFVADDWDRRIIQAIESKFNVKVDTIDASDIFDFEKLADLQDT